MRVSDSRVVSVSALSLGVFVVAVAVLHVAQSGLSPADHRISEYANGSPGWLMTVAFAAWSLALLTAGIAVLHSELRPRRLALALGVLLLIAGLGAAVSAVCPTGTSAGRVPVGHVLSAANHAHDVGSGALGLALWIAAVLSLMADDGRLRALTFVVLAFAVVAAIVLSGAPWELPGVRQRALVAAGCAWQLGLLARAAGRARGV